jgi:beta-glucosidase/6-phospho-beta-glucosidase/beta-galactosidase
MASPSVMRRAVPTGPGVKRPAGAAMTAIPFIGGFESTYMPAHDKDVTETTEHDRRWRADIRLLSATGVKQLRYPLRWHRIERAPGRYDWDQTDEALTHIRDEGMAVIADLVHHTSYPRWLDHGFADPRFGPAFLRFSDAVADRYPWLPAYTLFNEPFSTLFLAGSEAIWPPYLSGTEGFARLLRNVLPWVAEASRRYRARLPGARHVWVDTCEHHGAAVPEALPYAMMANQRRFVVLDLFLGRAGQPDECLYVDQLVAAGGSDLLALDPGVVDVLGLDYYAHCQWSFGAGPVPSAAPRPDPVPLSFQIQEYWDRYRLPCALTETNIRGYASDRATWLKYTLQQCELAAARGVPIEGYGWFPFIDSADWDSLLYRCEGNIDPVGVYWLDDTLARRPSSMSIAYTAAARGTPSSDLPAYRLRHPVAWWLRGYLGHVPDWRWQLPPSTERGPDDPASHPAFELRLPRADDRSRVSTETSASLTVGTAQPRRDGQGA